MVDWHLKSKRKKSGGMRRSLNRRGKRLYEKGGLFTATKADESKSSVEAKRGVGGKPKFRLTDAKYANVLDPKTGKTTKMELVSVDENEANREYPRRNIITKGAVVEVKSGSDTLRARVTSRPGQHGTANAILLA